MVLHLISNRDTSGGTIAATNLHHALLRENYKSILLSTDSMTGTISGKGYRKFGGITGRLQQALLKLENLLAKPGLINPIDKLVVEKGLENFDGVLHIHVTHVAQSAFSMMNWLGKNRKVFWTLHDLWPLTAKCIQPTYCNKWETGCHTCPKLDEYPILKWDNTPNLYSYKWKFIKKHHVHFISPANWIKNQTCMKINDGGGTISTIHHGINTSVFKPDDVTIARTTLNLPLTDTIIFFPQGRWDDKKKGIEWYNTIKLKLSENNLQGKFILLRLGDNNQTIKYSESLSEIVLRKTNSPKVMANYYQASDVSVSLSEAETFGLCVAESISCGIPVVGRNAPGVNELVDINFLKDNVDELVVLIKEKAWTTNVGSNTTQKLNFSESDWAKKHISLYES